MQTIFRQLPHCAKPMESFSTAKDYYGSKLVGSFQSLAVTTSRCPPGRQCRGECHWAGVPLGRLDPTFPKNAGRCYDA